MTAATAVKPSYLGGAALPDAVLVPHLFSIAKSIRQLAGIKLAEIGGMVGQDQCLLALEDDETVSVSALAARLSVRPSTVSKMVDRLQERGWVVRSIGSEDLRNTLVSLTDAGCRMRDAVRAVEAKLEAELVGLLNERSATIRTLAELDAVITTRLSRLR
jgi:MarR family transcriptional regulator, organic hydroperoxide resistance regulator